MDIKDGIIYVIRKEVNKHGVAPYYENVLYYAYHEDAVKFKDELNEEEKRNNRDDVSYYVAPIQLLSLIHI